MTKLAERERRATDKLETEQSRKKAQTGFSASVLATSPAPTSSRMDDDPEVKKQTTPFPTPLHLHPQHGCFGSECFIIATEINQNRTKYIKWAFEDSFPDCSNLCCLFQAVTLAYPSFLQCWPRHHSTRLTQTTINL